MSGTAFAFLFGLTLPALIVIVLLLNQRRTLRRQLEGAERDRAALRLAENIGGVGTWMVDNRTRTLHWSDKVYAIHGRDPSIGTPKLADAIDYYHKDDRAKVADAVSHALDRGQPFQFKARLIDEAGAEKAVIARGVCQVGETGNVDLIFGVFIETSPSISISQIGNDNSVAELLR